MTDTMRGVSTNLTRIRRQVFDSVASVAYANNPYEDDGASSNAKGKDEAKTGANAVSKAVPQNDAPQHATAEDYSWADKLPYQILPGDKATYRESIFLERAIIGERIRLALGLNLNPVDKPANISDGIKDAERPETYYEPPLVNVIKFACHACPTNSYIVTNQCQGCLAHPCIESCPKNAISFVNNRAYIDQDLCIKCGRCKAVCPYTAIIHRERPCEAACGMHCIHSDEEGRAEIDHEKCVSCGQCLINCPFGAIADKSQIFQVIRAIQHHDEVYAAVAPAFVGQYGGRGDVGKLREAFAQLGFAGIEEVAFGADFTTLQEAQDFLDEVPSKLPFMATSCCPAWASMAKQEFPDEAKCISMALTPMTLTARFIKQQHPGAKVVFVGPCSAKKLEAMRKDVRSDVDFVLTFEEVAGMLAAKGIDYKQLPTPEDNDFSKASADGRGYAVAGGVANAVAHAIHKEHPEREVKIHAEDSLDSCRAMLKQAAKGKYDGYLLEGMACPGGCVAGAGTLQDIKKSQVQVEAYTKRSPIQDATDDPFKDDLEKLVD